MTDWQNRMFHGYLVGRPYLRDTHENQLSPSCPDSLHSNHVQGTCFTSREAYSRATCKTCFSLHTLSLSHTTLTNKTHIKYRVHKIEQNCNQIWHRLYNLHTLQFPPFGYSMTKPLKQTLDLNVSLGTMAKLTHT